VKSSGPSTDPWGTPETHRVVADECSPSFTYCDLSVRYERSQPEAPPSTPNWFMRWLMRTSWFMVLMAAEIWWLPCCQWLRIRYSWRVIAPSQSNVRTGTPTAGVRSTVTWVGGSQSVQHQSLDDLGNWWGLISAGDACYGWSSANDVENWPYICQ